MVWLAVGGRAVVVRGELAMIGLVVIRMIMDGAIDVDVGMNMRWLGLSLQGRDLLGNLIEAIGRDRAV